MSTSTFPLYLNRTNTGGKVAPIVFSGDVDGVAVQAWMPFSLFGNFAMKGEGWAASFDLNKDGSVRVVGGSCAGHQEVIFKAASEVYRYVYNAPAPAITWQAF